MRKILLYALAAAGAGYAAIIYNSKGFLMLFGAAVLLLPFLLCMLWYSRKHMDCELLFSSYPEEDGRYRVRLFVNNNSPFYLAEVRAKVVLKRLENKEKYTVKIAGRVGAGKKVKLEGNAGSLEFGAWQAECRYLACYDCLGLFAWKKKVKQKKQVMIFPACYETNVKAGIRTRLFLADGEVYHPQSKGDDPAEVLKLRGYQKGDRLNRVHWKLSARNDEYAYRLQCGIVFRRLYEYDEPGNAQSLLGGIEHCLSGIADTGVLSLSGVVQ